MNYMWMTSKRATLSSSWWDSSESWRKQWGSRETQWLSHLNVDKGISGKDSKRNIPGFPTKCSHNKQLQMPVMPVGINWSGWTHKNDATTHSSLLITDSHDFAKWEKKKRRRGILEATNTNKVGLSHFLLQVEIRIWNRTELWEERSFLFMLTLAIWLWWRTKFLNYITHSLFYYLLSPGDLLVT